MLQNQYDTQKLPCNTSWTIDGFNEKEKQKVIRKFINSAIYVEKEVKEMPLQRKTSTLLDSNCDFKSNTSISKDAPGITNQNYSDSMHDKAKKMTKKYSNSNLSRGLSPESGYLTKEHTPNCSTESQSSLESQITVKRPDLRPFNGFSSEIRLSLSSLSTNRACTLEENEKQEIVQSWLAKKEQERKCRIIQEAKVAAQKEEEQKRLIEKERDNFKKWLAEKKKEEERKKQQQELEAEEEKLKEALREKKKVENEISYNLWLRRKRKDDLEKRIQEKLALLQTYEEKQRKIEENQRAYQEWLEGSKYRQKPIPMNQGLQSLCSSASVTYINPIPWNPNIPKPSSQ